MVIYATNYHPSLVIAGGKVGYATVHALKQKDIPVHLLERDESIRAKLHNIRDRTLLYNHGWHSRQRGIYSSLWERDKEMKTREQWRTEFETQV